VTTASRRTAAAAIGVAEPPGIGAGVWADATPAALTSTVQAHVTSRPPAPLPPRGTTSAV
jgi:hypothetical protein